MVWDLRLITEQSKARFESLANGGAFNERVLWVSGWRGKDKKVDFYHNAFERTPKPLDRTLSHPTRLCGLINRFCHNCYLFFRKINYYRIRNGAFENEKFLGACQQASEGGRTGIDESRGKGGVSEGGRYIILARFFPFLL